MNRTSLPLLLAGLLSAGAAGLLAAAPSADLAGRVFDSAGQVVPGVAIRVTQTATGLTRSTQSSHEGLYLVPALPPGEYELEAIKAGFQKLVVRKIVLNVASTARQDLMLDLGVVSTAIEVNAGNTLLEPEAMSISTTVDKKFVTNLPLNGRSFQTLLEMAPGVTLVAATGAASPGQFVVNGQRSNANYFIVDGVAANLGASGNVQVQQQAAGSLPGLTAMGGTNNLVSVDALEEFRVQTSTFAPEYGRMPGGQVTVTTRSGTNRFTGSLYEYFRNEKLDANDWFANAAGTRRAPMRQNNFGGVLGGPILLPRLYNGRNRTFFFVSYEGQRNRLPQFSESLTTTQALRDASIPGMKAVLRMTPLPNRPALAGDPTGTGRYVVSYSDPQHLNATAVKINHQFSARLSAFGRVNIAPSDSAQRVFSNQANALTLRTTTATAGADFAITPRAFNELRFNYSRQTTTWDMRQLLVDGAQEAPSQLWPDGADRNRMQVSVSMLNFNYGTPNNLTLGRVVGNGQKQWNLVNNFSIVKGAHTLKTGVDWRVLNPLASLRDRSISYTFASPEGAARTGVAGSVSVQGFSPPGHFTFQNFSLYAQDSWRVLPRLTLTYGLRWEVNPPPTEREGKLPYTAVGLDNPLTASLAPLGTPLWETSYGNLAPRLGASYQLSKRHAVVVRSGWGIYYDIGTGTALSGYSGWPYSRVGTTANVAFPASAATIEVPAVTLTKPVSASGIYAFPGLKLPRTYQWNVTVEKGLGANSLLSASYVGASGRRLLGRDLLRNRAAAGTAPAVTELNPSEFANGSLVYYVKNRSESDYHALQAQFRRRMARGLQTQVSYTWAKSIDDLSDETATTLPLVRPEAALQRGPSDFDIRHTLTAALSWDLPRTRFSSWADSLTRGWGVDAMGRVRTAMPVNLVQSSDLLNAGVTSVVRPDLVAGQALTLDDAKAPGGHRLNRAAFATFTDARQGSLGRNAVRGFNSARQLDLSLRRDFRLVESARLQFRGDLFNVTNTPNFGQPALSLTSATFGLSSTMLNRSLGSFSSGGSSQGFSPLYQIGGARSVQLSLRLSF
jgi:hypothetical protein